MSKIETTEEELLAIEMSFAELTRKFIQEGYDPYACAAVMAKLAFMIYRTSMNDEEYNYMIDSISESRDQIKSFHTVGKLSERLN